MLGCCAISIGIAAVVTLSGTGDAVRDHIRSQFTKIAGDVVRVVPSNLKGKGSHVYAVSFFETLTEKDVKELVELPGVRGAAGEVQSRGAVKGIAGTKTGVAIHGVQPPYLGIRRIQLTRGRLLNDDDERTLDKVVVLVGSLAREVCGDMDPLGSFVSIDGVRFRVVGIATEASSEGSGSQNASVAFIPLRTAMHRLSGKNYLDTIHVRLAYDVPTQATMSRIREALRRTHRLSDGRRDDFAFQLGGAELTTELEAGHVIQAFARTVALIALLTGGIGVLGLMLLAVRERSREIGLRRALGARRRDVCAQFLFESATLCLVAGAVGAMLGVATNAVVCLRNGWPLAMPLGAVFLATLSAVVIGLISGLLPAFLAARLDPDRALRL